MKVWLLQIGEQLPVNSEVTKLRTWLLADKLVDRGHEVLWWASAFDHIRKEMVFSEDTDIQVEDGLRVRALKGIGYWRTVSLRRYTDHRIIARKFRRQAPMLPKPDVIVASMPDHHLANEAVTFAWERNIPIIVDIRDLWPDNFLEVIPRQMVSVARAVLADDFRKIRQSLSRADALVSMMSSLLEWGLDYAERSATWKDRVFYLGTQPLPPVDSATLEALPDLVDQLNGKFVVTYIGTFGVHNHPLALIRTARYVNEAIGTGDRFAFVIAGDGVLRQDVVKEAQGLTNVFLPGWLNKEAMSVLLAVSSVGVIPWSQPGYAFPNKAFSYFRAGLPVLASVEGDLKQMLSQCHIGFHFEPNDHVRLAELIRHMADHPGEVHSMSKNVRALYDERLDSARIYQAYADHVEAVASI